MNGVNGVNGHDDEVGVGDGHEVGVNGDDDGSQRRKSLDGMATIIRRIRRRIC